jgi:3-oxoadipate enol-lactonase
MTGPMDGSRTGFADTEAGGRLFFEVAGDGPPVVLIHAGLWDSRIWDDQMPAFAARHRVLRYDIRGFGRSDGVSGAFSHRGDLADVMDAVGMDRAALVGCSIGGSLAIDFTLDRPARVDALVAVCSGMSGDQTPDDPSMEAVFKEAEKAFEAGDLARVVDLELQVWCPLRTDPDVDRRIRAIAHDNERAMTMEFGPNSAQLDPPAAGRLGEIRVPTLVISGDRDASVMEVLARTLASGIPDARHEVMRGADHLPNMRDPKTFNRVVLEFLGSVAPAGG